MSVRSFRGVSLLEVLASTFLLAMVMVVSAQMMASYSRVARQGKETESGIDAAQVAMMSVAKEIRESTAVTSQGPILRLQKIAPDLANRLPATPAPAGPYQPFVSGNLVNVTYALGSDGRFSRAVSGPSVTSTNQTVCAEVYGFDASSISSGSMVVKMELRIKEKVQVVRMNVYRPMP